MQASFIPRRQASDNIFVAQEVIHTIRRSVSKNGLMAIKIDLEKAYDRVRWDFLRATPLLISGPPRHNAPIPMTIPLILLAFGSLYLANRDLR